jgi:hypothetical protein
VAGHGRRGSKTQQEVTVEGTSAMEGPVEIKNPILQTFTAT